MKCIYSSHSVPGIGHKLRIRGRFIDTRTQALVGNVKSVIFIYCDAFFFFFFFKDRINA